MTFLKTLVQTINQENNNLQKSIHELKSLGIEITGRCNLQCRHCYMSSTPSGAADLSAEEWGHFFRRLKEDFGSSILVQVTGGEPLSRPDCLDILRQAHDLGFRFSLVSNGLLLNSKTIQELKSMNCPLSVSLDGLQESHDYLRKAPVFGRTIEAIRQAKQEGLAHLVIKTTVYKANLADLPELGRFLKELGVDEWHLFPMEPIGRGCGNRSDILSLDQYLEFCSFIDRIRKDRRSGLRIRFEEQGLDEDCGQACRQHEAKRCGAGIVSCAVLHNGDVINCIQDDRAKLEVHGNIRRNSLREIWEKGFVANRSPSYTYCDNHYFLNLLCEKQ